MKAQKVTGASLTPAQAACLESWIIDAPGQSPAWQQYHVGLIHLREIPGVEPAHKQYPEAQYEIMLHALSPDVIAVPDDLQTLRHLHPANHVQQFHGINDEQAVEILRGLVKLVLAGELPAEPLLSTGGGADRQWAAATQSLLSQCLN